MRMVVNLAFAIWAAIILAGCAGKDFVRPSSDTFKLGQSTYADVTKQLGEPRRTGDVLKNGKSVKTISYAYATMGGEPLEPGVIPARGMAYYFSDDKLVGQEFVSSFKSDNSNFDETKVEKIVKGTTTSAQVIEIFGQPTASYIFPMIKANPGEAIGYAYATASGGALSGLKAARKSLAVSLDADGVVTDVEYASSSNK